MADIEIASLTHVGLVRTKNQDACGEFQNEQGVVLLVVADGMGGHRGGEVASAAAIEVIGKHFDQGVDEPAAFLTRAFQAANDRILELANNDPKLAHMGTTGVGVLLLPDGSAWVANVGDSRAYLLRDGTLQRLSDDHSWVAEQVRAGRLTEEEAEKHPRRNVLARCLGIQPAVEVDVERLDTRPGDQFMLCSDGLWGQVAPSRIVDVLTSEGLGAATQRLIELANDGGGQDNATVQIARLPQLPAQTLETAVLTAAPDPQPRAALGRKRWSAILLGAAATIIALLLMLARGSAAATPLALEAPTEAPQARSAQSALTER